MGRPIRGREFLWGSWWAGSRSGSLESAGLVPQDVGSPFPTCLLPSPSEREKEESWNVAQTLVRNPSLLIQRDQPLDRTAHCAVMSAWGAVMSSWRKDCVLLVQRELVRLWSSVPTPQTLCLLVFGHVCLVMALGGSSGWTAIACCPAHLGSVSPCQWSVFSLPGQEGQWRSLLDGRPGLA